MKFRPLMGNYIPHELMHVVTYPWHRSPSHIRPWQFHCLFIIKSTTTLPIEKSIYIHIYLFDEVILDLENIEPHKDSHVYMAIIVAKLLLIHFIVLNKTINAELLLPFPPLNVFPRRGITDCNPGDFRVMTDRTAGNESFPFSFVGFCKPNVFVNSIRDLLSI